MVITTFCNIFTVVSNTRILTSVWFIPVTCEPSTLTHELNCILLLDYKPRLPKHNIKNTRPAGLHVCDKKVGLTSYDQNSLVFTSVLLISILSLREVRSPIIMVFDWPFERTQGLLHEVSYFHGDVCIEHRDLTTDMHYLYLVAPCW